MTKSSGPMAPPAISNLVTTLWSITWFSSACIIEPSWFFSVRIIEPSWFIVRSHQQRNLPQAYTQSQLFSHVYSPVPDRPRDVYAECRKKEVESKPLAAHPHGRGRGGAGGGPVWAAALWVDRVYGV